MPYPPHYLLSWGGDFTSDPSEVWTNNLRLAVDDNVDLAQHISLSTADIQSALADCVTKIKAHMSNSSSGYGANTRLLYVKLNEIDSQGLYKSSTESNSAFQTGSLTTGGLSTTMPLTTSLVITFLTSAARGPGSRGRVFVPQPAISLTAAGNYRIPAATCQGFMNQWRTFLDGLELGTTQNPIRPAVVSDRNTGVARTIMSTQCGDIPDYMGSRRNRLKETRYTSTTFN